VIYIKHLFQPHLRVRLFLHLAKNRKLCYTYDELSRVTSRTEKTLSGAVLHTECFTYDAAGNVTDCATDCCMQYDKQDLLTQATKRERLMRKQKRLSADT
jgi:hypothetical protein